MLQQAGLNYFLFLDNVPMWDLLPYSRLFAPDILGRFLGIKWTDGTAFLLTWIGPEARPIDQAFLETYARHLATDDHEWFKFPMLVNEMAAAVSSLRSSTWGEPVKFALARNPPAGGIDVTEATYGRSCRQFRPQPPARNTFSEGNATRVVRGTCSGKTRCAFTVRIPPWSTWHRVVTRT